MDHKDTFLLITVDTRCLEFCGAWKKKLETARVRIKNSAIETGGQGMVKNTFQECGKGVAKLKPSRITKKKNRYVKYLFCVSLFLISSIAYLILFT